MCTSVAARFPSAECFVVPPSTTAPAGTTTRPKSGSRSTPPDLEGYRRAADLLNFANTDVVCLQQDHLLRMTDETGILQHATHAFPNIVEGYCTDDNARALLLTVYLTGPELDRLATRYAAFLQAAFIPAAKRFRNFLAFDRRWLEEVGSDDSPGRALWALGTCVGRSRRRDIWRGQRASHFELAPACCGPRTDGGWSPTWSAKRTTWM
jgi:hypothetical protein